MKNEYTLKMKNIKNVKTVRAIRREYEKYVYNYLKTDLAKQYESLYGVVRNGSMKNTNAIKLAINILKSGDPISRISCQMITNINPYKNIYAAQFVIWNERKIRLNGSLGGNNKFICNYDLAKNKSYYNKNKHLNRRLCRKNNLLRNSLCVKFKPGPLTKKHILDDSYQKHNVGSIKLIKLPKICLEINPLYGASLEPTICNTIIGTREENGYLSENWAHFAASALGTVINNRLIQCTNENNISFNTTYKNGQSRMLMRCDDQLISKGKQHNITFYDNITTDCSEIQRVVESTIEKLLNSVEISLNQDEMYSVEDLAGSLEDELTIDSNRITKDKGKRNSELQRLDVTVIRLAETNTNTTSRICSNSFCKMGCICASLQCGYNVRKHCGRIDCMFSCNCEFSKCEPNYAVDDETHSQLIPTILHLEGKINHDNLSKEEKKFHQTVVVNNDNTIILQSSKRNRTEHGKIPSKKSILAENKQLMIVLSYLNCENVQIWCMVHQLYSCFCKGRILELSHEDNDNLNHHNDTYFLTKEEPIESDLNIEPVPENTFKSVIQGRKRKYIDRVTTSDIKDNNTQTNINDNCSSDTNNTNNHNDTTLSQIESGETQFQLYKHIGLLKIWLEATHSMYRTQKAAGTYHSNLGPPCAGQLVLQPWETILSRYNEKKNHFYVSISKPYRKFITITDLGNTFPRECININEIRFADLPKYCSIIKNLLTNGSCDADQEFCILHGLSNCWEIIACVKRAENDNKGNCDLEWKCFSSNNLLNTPNNMEEGSFLSFNGDNDRGSLSHIMSSNTNLDICKWFIMKIENDLSQLVFFRKGFFVQLDKISHAIKTARISGKTVRLSAISTAVNGKSPQFGIYALPNMKESLLLVGPYGKDEKKEIKMIRQENIITDNKTRGVWLPVNKIDNIKVLKDPLLFLSKATGNNMIIDFNNAEVIPNFVNDSDVSTCALNSSALNETAKKIDTSIKNKFVVKPIKINKANGFYELDSNGRLKLKSPPHLPSTSSVCSKDTSKVSLLKEKFNNCMSILNPDEINKRSLENKITVTNIEQTNYFKTPNVDTVVVISDDEDDTISDTFPNWHEVWIECTNISNLGCLHGRRNNNNEISFQFPSFEFTQFYPMQEAFDKINLVLSRKVFLPRSVKPIWKIQPKTCDNKNKCVLKNEHLGPDIIITRKGLRHKKDLLNTNYAELMSGLKELNETVISDPDNIAVDPQKVMTEAIKLIKTLQEESNMLKTKKENLQLEHSYKQSKLLKLLLPIDRYKPS